VLVELRTPDVDEKKLRNEPNHGAGILVVPEIARASAAYYRWLAIVRSSCNRRS
jgi:hypothetical protein